MLSPSTGSGQATRSIPVVKYLRLTPLGFLTVFGMTSFPLKSGEPKFKEAMRTDMQDFKVKTADFNTLSDSFQRTSTIITSNATISADIVDIADNSLLLREIPRARAPLSKREMQIARMIGLGKTVGHIAVELGLSVKTISTYRVRALQKLGVASNADLTQYILTQPLDDSAQDVSESSAETEDEVPVDGSPEHDLVDGLR